MCQPLAQPHSRGSSVVTVSDALFDAMVDDALDTIPDEFAAKMRNLVFLVRDYNEDNPDTLGLYVGVALTERTFDHTGFLPDTIFIYREALKSMCNSVEELAQEVRVTVLHEVGHYFGFDEERLHALGWG